MMKLFALLVLGWLVLIGFLVGLSLVMEAVK